MCININTKEIRINGKKSKDCSITFAAAVDSLWLKSKQYTNPEIIHTDRKAIKFIYKQHTAKPNSIELPRWHEMDKSKF